MAKQTPAMPLSVTFVDNPAITGREQNFTTVTITLAPVLASWRESMFAHEWLNENGTLKTPDQQSDAVRDKRLQVAAKLEAGLALERPVLGIGIMDNVEIGAGRDTLLTLASAGIGKIAVHIPRSHLDDFRLFIKDQV